MRFALVHLAFAAPLALVALPAQAQHADPVASDAIFSGDYSRAELELRQELRIHPGRPELLLNLAAVYAKTGRAAEARDLYVRVLAEDEVLMDLASDRTAGSHLLARAGLRRLEPVRTASGS